MVSSDERALIHSFPGARAEEFHNRNAGLPKMSLGRQEQTRTRLGKRMSKFTSKMMKTQRTQCRVKAVMPPLKRGIPPSAFSERCLSCHPEPQFSSSGPAATTPNFPQIPQWRRRWRWQTYSAVIDGRRPKKDVGRERERARRKTAS